MSQNKQLYTVWKYRYSPVTNNKSWRIVHYTYDASAYKNDPDYRVTAHK